MRSVRTAGRLGATVMAVGMLVAIAIVVARSLWPEVEGPTIDISEVVADADHDRLERLLATGVDPDGPIEGGLSPLMRAAARDDAVAIELLTRAGAQPDFTGPEGITALHVAARINAPAATSALAAAGADLDLASHDGMNALHHGAESGSVDVVARLVELGTPVDDRSDVVTQGHGHPRDVGPTALSIATRAGRLEVVELLLDLGADVNGRSSRGITPVFMAVFADGTPQMLALLLSAGADPSLRIGCEAGCSVAAPLDALGWAVELEREDLIPLLGG